MIAARRSRPEEHGGCTAVSCDDFGIADRVIWFEVGRVMSWLQQISVA
jgi:hypothetical protein